MPVGHLKLKMEDLSFHHQGEKQVRKLLKPSIWSHFNLVTTSVLSIIGVAFAAAAVLVPYWGAQEDLQVVKSVTEPRLSVQEKDGRPILIAEYSIAIHNASTATGSLFGMKCTVGRKASLHGNDVRLRADRECGITERQVGEAKKLSGVLNIEAKRTTEITLRALIDPEKKIANKYDEFKKGKSTFDGLEFLRFLDRQGLDIFGNDVADSDHDLKVMFGEGLCLGLTFEFRSSTADKQIRQVEDFYVGPDEATLVCPDRSVPRVQFFGRPNTGSN
jgi:hypothetical protein